MTPLEHYREAERLLTESRLRQYLPQERVDCLLEAQVHATLANAHMTAGAWNDEVKQ